MFSSSTNSIMSPFRPVNEAGFVLFLINLQLVIRLLLFFSFLLNETIVLP